MKKYKLLFVVIAAIIISSCCSSCCSSCWDSNSIPVCEIERTGEVIVKNNLNVPVYVTIRWASAPNTDLKIRTFEVGLINAEIVTGYDYGDGDGEMVIKAEGYNIIPSPMLIDVISCRSRRYQINSTNGKDAYVSVGATI